MSKLYVGSLGTLGIIVRANFKALPRPAARRLAIAPLADDVARTRDRRARAAWRSNRPQRSSSTASAARRTLSGADAAARAALRRFGGGRRARHARAALGARARRRRRNAAARRRRGGARLRRASSMRTSTRPANASLTYRTTGLPSTAWARTRAGEARRARPRRCTSRAIADLRTGDAIVRFSARTVAAFAARSRAFDAARARRVRTRDRDRRRDRAARARSTRGVPAPPTIATMRAIKAHFDPAGILAPGRYVGAI